MRYRVSENAERDLDEIFLYWAERASPEIADRIIDKITDRFWLLGEHPDAGKKIGWHRCWREMLSCREVPNLLPRQSAGD